MKHRRPIQHWRRYKSGRRTFVNRGIRYRQKVISLEERLRSFGSIPSIRERLTRKDEQNAVMRKQDVKKFFEDYPKYESKVEGLKDIVLWSRDLHPLGEKIQATAGGYTNKRIDLFPVEPSPKLDIGEVKEVYKPKPIGDFRKVMVHEIGHYEAEKHGIESSAREAKQEEENFLKLRKKREGW